MEPLRRPIRDSHCLIVGKNIGTLKLPSKSADFLAALAACKEALVATLVILHIFSLDCQRVQVNAAIATVATALTKLHRNLPYSPMYTSQATAVW